MKFVTIAIVAVALTATASVAQEREDRTLLSQDQMTAIINEVSGERAMANVLEIAPYQRVRKPAEYRENFRETQAVTSLARDYGFSNVAVDTINADRTVWQPTSGELWVTAPKSVKLLDIHDVPLALTSLSANGDFSGALVDVGAGSADDFRGKNVRGKFVLASVAPSRVYKAAIAAGAVGVLGVTAIDPQRGIDYPREIIWDQLKEQPGNVAWAISPAIAQTLRNLLASGAPVTLRSTSRSEQVSGKEEIVHAEIPGDGSTGQQVGISCHLFEGVIKQGANDDASGCALLLEIGRAYLQLIRQGKLPPPKRTINFQFVPELIGTQTWLDRHPDKARAMIGTLNFDMEAIRLAASRSYWILQRTPDSFPSYLNDIPQSMMEYVADITRERVRFREGLNGYAPSQPVESLRGSKDPFYIKIDRHYGASDHMIYMRHGIPAVMMITWPDMWYHSSDDTPDKQDSTQYKRAAVVGLGSLAVLADGTDAAASRVIAENLGRGVARMGEAQTRALGYLTDADATGLARAWMEARNTVLHQAEIERAVIGSARVLWTNPRVGQSWSSDIAARLDARRQALLGEVDAIYALKARRLGIAPVRPPRSALEAEAARTIVTLGPSFPRSAMFPSDGPGPQLPDEFGAELNILIGRENMTVLQIRDFLSGEFTPIDLAQLYAVLRGREKAGLVRLVMRSSRAGG